MDLIKKLFTISSLWSNVVNTLEKYDNENGTNLLGSVLIEEDGLLLSEHIEDCISYAKGKDEQI